MAARKRKGEGLPEEVQAMSSNTDGCDDKKEETETTGPTISEERKELYRSLPYDKERVMNPNTTGWSMTVYDAYCRKIMSNVSLLEKCQARNCYVQSIYISYFQENRALEAEGLPIRVDPLPGLPWTTEIREKEHSHLLSLFEEKCAYRKTLPNGGNIVPYVRKTPYDGRKKKKDNLSEWNRSIAKKLSKKKKK